MLPLFGVVKNSISAATFAMEAVFFWKPTFAIPEAILVSVLHAPKLSGQPDVSNVSCATTASKSKITA